jgi:DNA-binding SARP family transcriptional activator/tetratricopeptide (TPR) repeat protein
MSAGSARIQLCGEFVFELDDQRREGALRGRQGRLGFAYLLLRRDRPVRRDELIAALWPADSPPRGQALAPVLSRLRSAIAPAVIEGRDSVRLRLPEPAWIDVEVALAAIATARRALEQSDPPAALRSAREAVELLAGGLLPGHEAGWLEDERRRLDDLRIEALEVAALAAVGVGGATLPQAEADAREAVAAAPFRESARAALISVLTARGNAAEALRAYEDARALLMAELGTVPGPQLLALHASLLGGGQAIAEPASGVPLAPPEPRHDDAQRLVSPSGAGPSPGALLLVERDEEMRLIASLLPRVASGRGGVLAIEGPAGIGKTRLLAELRAQAPAEGFRVFDARAGMLEREFGFGVVRQLFAELAADSELTAPPAAAARGVLTDTGAIEGTFPILNGLHHLVMRLAADGPLILAVDDLQWGDPASLRFLVYLGRRLAQLPVLIVATIRTGEPDTDEMLIAELVSDPDTVVLKPRALTEAATGSLVRERLGEADAAFVAACQDVTAGNPLLLRQLLGALQDEGVDPDAARAAEVRAVGPRAVSRTVLARLARMPESTVAVARACAILGEQPGLPALAGVARTDETEAAAAVARLVDAEILRAEEPLGFVHPLVRDAVYAGLPAAARGLEHQRAAAVLSELGASPERVAAQLLLTPPRADPWVVTQLRDAADVAMRRGAPDAALRLLERAQAEPPTPDQRAALALELGGSAAYIRGPAGVDPLERAYAGLTDPVERARAAIRLSHLLLFVRSPQEGVAVARRAMSELPEGHDDLADGLRAIRLIGVQFGASDPDAPATRDAVRRGPRGSGPGARALTAMTALSVALDEGPAAEASDLAREAFSGGGLADFEVTAPVALATAVLTLGEPGEGLRAVERYRAHARSQGEILGSIGAELWGGFAALFVGDLRGAVEALERASEGEQLWGTKLDAVMAYSSAFLTQAWVERGDPLRARKMSDRMVDVAGAADRAPVWNACRAALLIAEGSAEDALELTREISRLWPAHTNPVWAPWRGVQARALAVLGRVDEAYAVATEELGVAERVAAPWVIGRGHRLLAQIGGPDALDHARAAVRLLAQTSARLELAKAHAALGEQLAALGDADARGALQRALDGAGWCGADALAARVELALSELPR